MAEHEIGQLLASSLQAVFARTGAEQAAALGAPVDATVGTGTMVDEQALQPYSEQGCLLVTGSLAGSVEGPVAYVLGREDAARLAAVAKQADGQAAGGGEQEALGEDDVAAVVFALAQLGAAATAVWREELGRPVQWPAEPTALAARLLEPGEGGAAVRDALGGEAAMGVRVHLGEPADAELLVAVAGEVGTAREQASAAEGAPQEDLTRGLARVLAVRLPVRVVVATRTFTVRELLQLVPGRVLDLEKPCGALLDLYAGPELLARGEAMLVGDRFGFRVSRLVRPGATTTDTPPALVR